MHKAYDVKLCLRRQTFDVVCFANATLFTKLIAETYHENNVVREKILINMYYIVYEPKSLYRYLNFKTKYFYLNFDKFSNVVFLKL